jgi:hypothetical protein
LDWLTRHRLEPPKYRTTSRYLNHSPTTRSYSANFWNFLII